METNGDDSKEGSDARHELPDNAEYYGWSRAEAIRDVERMEAINELRMLGLSKDEADEFWHSIYD